MGPLNGASYRGLLPGPLNRAWALEVAEPWDADP